MSNNSSKNFQIGISQAYMVVRDQYISGILDHDLAHEFIDIAKQEIYFKGIPSFSKPNNDDIKKQNYYHHTLERYLEASTNLKDELSENFFFYREDCYEYVQDITYSVDDEYFPFLFAIQLKGFENELHIIDQFLKYQFEVHFNNETQKFKLFVKSILTQFKTVLLNQKIISTTQDSLNVITQHNEAKGTIKDNMDNASIKSFSFKDPRLSENVYSYKIHNLVTSLEREKFLERHTNVQLMRNLFLNKQFTPKRKLVWKGSIASLKEFVNLLIKKEVVKEVDTDKWSIVINSFFNKEVGVLYQRNQLNTANGLSEKNKNSLEAIINDFATINDN